MSDFFSRACATRVTLAGICAACLLSIFPHQFGFASSKAEILTLNDAVKRSLEHHPSLKVFKLRETVLYAETEMARLRPPVRTGLAVENFSGSGPYSSLDSAEFTLSLSSVIELGGKRAARQSMVAQQYEYLDIELYLEALELLSKVNRHYIEILVLQTERELAKDAEALARATVEAVQHRVKVGASPEAELFRAQAALAKARLWIRQKQSQYEQARVALALHWGVSKPSFHKVEGALLQTGMAGDLERFYQRALTNPSMMALATEKRLREAELRLAKSTSRRDIAWSLGMRRFAAGDESAFMAEVSIPLFTQQRNKAAVRAAEMKRDEVNLHQEHASHKLFAALFDVFEQRKAAIEAKNSLQQEVIPLLEQAVKATGAAYELGRFSYLEWAAVQQELLDARKLLIESAAAAHLFHLEIERLTAEPLVSISEIEAMSELSH